MSLYGRIFYFSAFAVIAFLFQPPALLLADDCVQERSTLPVEATPENILAGKKLYQNEGKPVSCSHCHGILGKGKGLTASVMAVKPRDFTCQAMMKDISDGQLFWVIKKGSQGTNMWGYHTLSDKQIWQIVSYLRQFSIPRH